MSEGEESPTRSPAPPPNPHLAESPEEMDPIPAKEDRGASASTIKVRGLWKVPVNIPQ